MKVTITKYLNVRVGKPSVNAPCYQYLAPGSELEVDGHLYPGDKFEGIETWMKDDAGNYYWSGGIEKVHLYSSVIQNISDKWWIKDYQIPDIWKMGLMGKGIKIAILDTGISYPHPALDLDPQLFYDASKSPSGVKDNFGHGTHCAGIIKAANNISSIIGIAYEAILYVGKVTNDDFGDKIEYLVDGIIWAISQSVDIISISKGDPFGGNGKLEQVINEANRAGILIVAAAGNKEQGFPDDHIYYPARYSATLSVGGVDDKKNILSDTIVSNETNIFAPGKEIFSTYLNAGYCNLSGSSQAAPYLAAVAALLLEHKRKSTPSLKANEIKNIILNNSERFLYGSIINPIKLFE